MKRQKEAKGAGSAPVLSQVLVERGADATGGSVTGGSENLRTKRQQVLSKFQALNDDPELKNDKDCRDFCQHILAKVEADPYVEQELIGHSMLQASP